MNVSLYQAAAAMNATSRWQDLIAQNLGAGSAPGARRQDISFSSVAAGLAPAGVSGPGYVIPSAKSFTSFQPGELHPSGNNLDLALEGSGFFAVQMPNGATGYTRDGEFHLNAQGQLVNKMNYPVQGDGGPLQFDANSSAAITISGNGDVSQGSEVKGKLRLADFADAHSLTPIGGGLFLADKPDAQPVPVTAPNVRQGYLESGNTSPTAEMASLITAMRMFETNAKVLQMQDDRMGRAITDLGGTQ